MRRAVTIVCAAALTLSGAAAAAPVPKPWMWKPARIEKRLVASQPLAGDAGVASASCRGVGKAVAGRYSRFSCRIGWGGGPNLATQYVTVAVRVLPRGSGWFCFPVDADGRTAPGGMDPVAGRACPR